jgi:hypothetical protein
MQRLTASLSEDAIWLGRRYVVRVSPRLTSPENEKLKVSPSTRGRCVIIGAVDPAISIWFDTD